MNAQMTENYMAQQMNRTRLDQMAYQGWLAEEAAAHRDGQADGTNSARQLGRRWFGRLIQQVIGGMPEPARTAEEAITP
jgi:hypothetical protein